MEEKLSVKILSIKLFTGSGVDEIIITTNLNNGIYPFEGGQDIKINIAAKRGMQWIKDNLGMDIFNITEIINL